MPIHRSVLKRERQNIKRRARNRRVKSEIKTFIKKTESAISEGDEERAKEIFSLCQKKLDKAAKRRIIHRNKSARLKSRLAKRLSSICT
jgi:small subunit ribosomal protein S20